MCLKEPWGAIVAPEEGHSIQRSQPPRMHGPGLWRYEQKEQRVTPVPMSRVNSSAWGGTAKVYYQVLWYRNRLQSRPTCMIV